MNRSAIGFAAAAVVVLLIAMVASQFASDQPDGLEFVAEQQGFADAAGEHALAGEPLGDYGGNLGGSRQVNLAIAGAVGVAMTFALVLGTLWLVRARRPDRENPASS